MDIKQIADMKIIKVQTDLPYPKNNKEKNEIVFLYSYGNSDIYDIFNHNLIKRKTRYHNYFIEDTYKGTLYKRRYLLKRFMERKDYYVGLKKSINGIRPVNKLFSDAKANVFVDLLWYNEIFYNRLITIPLMKRPNEFITFYKNIINKPIYENYGKTILINVEQFNFTRTKTMDDPLCIIFFMLKRRLKEFKSLGDIDIVLYKNNMLFKINPSRCHERSYNEFRSMLLRMNPSYKDLSNDEEFDKLVTKQEKKVDAINSMIEKTSRQFAGPVAQSEEEDVDNEGFSKEEVAKLLAKADIGDLPEDADKETVEDKIIKEINKDKETLEKIYSKISGSAVVKSQANLKRDELIRQEHRKVKIDNMTVEDVLNTAMDVAAPKITTSDVSKKVRTPNKNVTEIKYKNIDKTYNEKLYKPDTIAAFDSLSKKEIPLYIRDLSIEDGSDEFNYVDTWTVQLEDTNRVRHTIKVDMPKFIDDHFLYLGGSKKEILNQEYFKPIVKVKENEVQLVSSYNKIFVRREGNKLSSSVEKFKKVFSEDKLPGLTLVRGNAGLQNKGFVTHIDYDDLAKLFMSIKVDKTKDIILFNQREIYEKLTPAQKSKLNHKTICVGFKGTGEPIFIPADGDFNFIDFLCKEILPTGISDRIKSATGGTRHMWSSATLMAKKVPLIILLGFFEGISSVMKKAKVSFKFSDKKPDPTNLNMDYIKFSDGYLCYECTNNISFLMNPLKSINTSDYIFEDFNDRAVYINLLESVYGQRNIVLALCNYYNSMIDPIMESMCRRLDYPTDLVELLLTCNRLLGDNQHEKDIDLNVYRIRCHEIIPAILYKEISDAYSRYYATASNKRPVKVSVPRNAVIKRLVSQKTVEDVNFLNPAFTSDRLRAVTPKGYVGTNLDDAYKLPNRSYHSSMLGVIGLSSPTDGNTGKIRIMSVSPNIVDARGFMDLKDINNKKDMNELKDCNMLTAAEMITVGSARHDDAIRTGMMSKQSGHLLPTDVTSPLLVSNGFEQTIQYQLPSEYSMIAEEDGEVIEVNEKLQITFVKYKSGKVQAIYTGNRIDKNGGGGFHLTNTLKCDLKLGDKVKKDDIIAYDSKFFKNDLFGNRMCVGTMCKAAIYSSYSTYEDSTRMTQGAAEKMCASITKEESVILDKNSNVDKIVEIGQNVEVGDDLITFEPGFDEEIFNDLLVSVGDRFNEEIKSIGKQKIDSHYQGKIVDIKIYCGCDVEEMSPSLQKIVKKYYAGINATKRALEKYDPDSKLVKCGMLFNKTTEKYDTTDSHGKIKGHDVGDGILILFYIEYRDIIGVGDKIANFSAIKSTVGEIIPRGQEPFSLFRPKEPIELFLPSSSVLKRMAKSAPDIGCIYKVLVELKRKLGDIYYDRPYPSDKY